MGALLKIVVLFVALLVGLFFAGVLTPEPDAPAPRDGWWGRGPRAPDTDTAVKPFKVSFPEEDLQDLHSRLERARFGEDLVDTRFHYGFPVREMRKIADHWRRKYDWRKHEAELNGFPQFKTRIEGIDVHFMRVKPRSGRPGKPLLLVHGWPGSVWEFYKFIPLLTDPASHGGVDADAFEVIAPSIPGYGFSEQPHRKGFNAMACAGVFVKLMRRLGHDRFYTQGGDWGGAITTAVAQVYPSAVFGLHTSMPIPAVSDARLFLHQVAASYAPELVLGEEHARHFRPLGELFPELLLESGYLHIQATKPDTVGMALNDSPLGLAGYILEKYSSWTSKTYKDLPDGGLTKKFTLDELLTNVMIYWISGNIAASQRLYKEHFSQIDVLDRVPVTVPSAIAMFPDEISESPRPLVEYKYKDIVQFTYMPRGGHFNAFEEPQLLAEDFMSFVKKVEARDKIKYPAPKKEGVKIVAEKDAEKKVEEVVKEAVKETRATAAEARKEVKDEVKEKRKEAQKEAIKKAPKKEEAAKKKKDNPQRQAKSSEDKIPKDTKSKKQAKKSSDKTAKEKPSSSKEP